MRKERTWDENPSLHQTFGYGVDNACYFIFATFCGTSGGKGKRSWDEINCVALTARTRNGSRRDLQVFRRQSPWPACGMPKASHFLISATGCSTQPNTVLRGYVVSESPPCMCALIQQFHRSDAEQMCSWKLEAIQYFLSFGYDFRFSERVQ